MTHRFVIVRTGEPETRAVVEVESETLQRRETVDAVSRAITAWVRNTAEGKNAYADSSEDYNIGDLSQDQEDPTLQPFLRAEGIERLTVEIQAEDEADEYWTYDFHLVDDDALEEEEA